MGGGRDCKGKEVEEDWLRGRLEGEVVGDPLTTGAQVV